MPPPVRRCLLAAAALLLCAAPAAAQHCWPSSFMLVLRDSLGTAIHPGRFDSISYTPQASDGADYQVQAQVMAPEESGGLAGGLGLPVLHWFGRGDCRVLVQEVVLWENEVAMRLLTGVEIDTDRDPGPSRFVVEAPPFQPGTWRLSPLPPGTVDAPTVVRAEAWQRVASPPE